MKNKIITFLSIIIFIIFIGFFLSSIIDKNNEKITQIENIENIKKSIVKIIPEKHLINFENNPHWVNDSPEYWIWTGFFINKNNEIITANHVVSSDNIKYYIITHDNNKYQANIISRDPQNDIAKITIDSSIKYNSININNKQNNKIWDQIYSFWINPQNLEIIYVTWKITSKNKKLDNISNLLEFTPKITKWFSWWPIINTNIEAIWINHAIKTWNSYWIFF